MRPACLVGCTLVANLAAGCGAARDRDGDASVSDGGSVNDGPAIGLPDSCPIVDCFGGLSCVDGLTTIWESNDLVSCEEYEAHGCPRETVKLCSEGCAVDPSYLPHPFELDPDVLCEGAYAHQPGDSCYDHCVPTHAVVGADGSVVNEHLACDDDSRTCVSADPPWWPDWLAPCGDTANAYAGTGATGYFDDGTGLCLIHDDAVAGCVRQGRTRGCNGDWDCPGDAYCEDELERYGTVAQFGVCTPAPASHLGQRLACP